MTVQCDEISLIREKWRNGEATGDEIRHCLALIEQKEKQKEVRARRERRWTIARGLLTFLMVLGAMCNLFYSVPGPRGMATLCGLVALAYAFELRARVTES
ncbi:hypothetical protein H8F21_14005 [Pseudomonas sp. P66]|uniref:DUF2335 domain-containing protein n=1 Tax=Pseudomonas arcuscaelestis TaxID=2710591 RepID=A0ABS2C035_9PSED|nr:hypothetical protein [Pseudomonas arcuscaelestis]MBM5458678.1 hypothetical protein [Pseudomonas arcuscaelestis]